MQSFNKLMSRTTLVVLVSLSGAFLSTAALAQGTGNPPQPVTPGMVFSNTSSAPFYILASSVTDNITDKNTAANNCPTITDKTKGDTTVLDTLSTYFTPNNTQVVCAYVTTLAANGGSEPQNVVIPILSGNNTEFNTCTSLAGGVAAGQKVSCAVPTCVNNEYAPGNVLLPMITGSTTQQIFAKPKDGAISLPNDFLSNQNFSLTYAPVPKDPSGMGCIFNVDLSMYDQDVLPVAPPSFQLEATQIYTAKTNPVLDLSTAFIDRWALNTKSTANTKYFVTVGTSTSPTQVQPITDGMSPISGNPLNLQYNYAPSGNATYQNILFTSDVPSSNDSQCTGGICQINICSCEPGVTAAALDAGQGGVCPGTGIIGGMTSCTPPTGTNCTNGATWTNGTGPVGVCFDVNIYNGIYGLSPTDLQTYNQNNPTLAPINTMIALPQAGTGSATVDLSKYFATSDDSDLTNATYHIVNNESVLVDHNNGDNPVADPANPPANYAGTIGAGWEPMILANGSKGTSLTDTQISSMFSINGDQLTVTNTSGKDEIVQFTVEATINDHTTYETLYLNLSDKNKQTDGSLLPIFTLMPTPGISAWMYDAKPLQNSDGTCNTTQTPSTQSNAGACSVTAWDYPNCMFANTLNNAGVSIVTPDIGWVEFGTSGDYRRFWDNTTGPLDNNIYTAPNVTDNSSVDCTAAYFKNAAPNTKFVVTYEFDSPLKGYLSNVPNALATWKQGNFTRMTELVSNVGAGVANDKWLDGMQFDVEPLPTDANSTSFFKRIADLLARQGKINEIFAFADANSPALIMAQGPLGIFLPSTYDVGQSTDPFYYNQGKYCAFGGLCTNPSPIPGTPLPPLPAPLSNTSTPTIASGCPSYPAAYFYSATGTTPPSCALQQYDYACHFDSTGQVNNNFLIKSYCNIDVNNTMYTNAYRFGIKDGENPGIVTATTPDFALNERTFGGHFQLAVPSEGSATNWTYEIVYTPRLSNGSGGSCDTTKTTPCVIPSVPSTYKAIYIPTTTGYTNTGLQQAAVASSQAYPPAVDTYEVFYTPSSALHSSNTTPPCSMNEADDTGLNTMCGAIVVSANANPENDPSANQAFPVGANNLSSQYTYTNSVIKLAEAGTTPENSRYSSAHQVSIGQPDLVDFSRYSPEDHIILGNPQENPNNLGLAFYAIADEGAYGCVPGGSHGGVANCMEDYPMSTIYPTTGTAGNAYGGDIWGLAYSYIGGTPPPVPAQIMIVSSTPLSSGVTYHDSVTWTTSSAPAGNLNFRLFIDNDPTHAWTFQNVTPQSSYAAYWGETGAPGNNQPLMDIDTAHVGYIQLLDNTGKVLASASASISPPLPYTITINPIDSSDYLISGSNYQASVTWNVSPAPPQGSTLRLYVNNVNDGVWSFSKFPDQGPYSAYWGKNNEPGNEQMTMNIGTSYIGHVDLLDSTGKVIGSAAVPLSYTSP